MHYEVEVKGEEEEFSFSTDDFLPDTKYRIEVQAVSEGQDGGVVYGVDTVYEADMFAGCKRSLTIILSIELLLPKNYIFKCLNCLIGTRQKLWSNRQRRLLS